MFKYTRFFWLYMNWPKALLALVVILLYIPLVFMGANVFFPKYTGSESYYQAYDPCTYPKGDTAAPVYVQNDTCYQEQQAAQKQFEEDKANYDSQKYIFIAVLNLIVLLIALFAHFDESVLIGLFLGTTLSSFFSTWTYFDTKSKIGFGILFIIFFVTIYFITKKKNIFYLKETYKK